MDPPPSPTELSKLSQYWCSASGSFLPDVIVVIVIWVFFLFFLFIWGQRVPSSLHGFQS
jgi:hypothetical protein